MFPCALTVAGLDNCGGAGVAADLKTFSMLKVHGACAVTALTAQNTLGVQDILPVIPEFVAKQLETVLSDLDVGAVKTGMLFSGKTVEVVAGFVERYRLRLVVDPVLKSTSGHRLAEADAVQAYVKKLLPLASVVTPNVPEAEALAGCRIRDMDGMERAAEKISKLGVESVVIKGGHLKGGMVKDLFLHDDELSFYIKPRAKHDLHGGGCFFSAAVTAHLTRGLSIPEAVEEAESVSMDIYGFGLKVGRGNPVVNPLIPLYNEAERWRVMEEVKLAAEKILKSKHVHRFIADVGTQVAMALPYPSAVHHMAAVEGRIRRTDQKTKTDGQIRFGVSSHMARLILACNQLNSEIRAALNLHYDEKLLEALKRIGLTVSSFTRKIEPEKLKMMEGKTIQWGAKQAAKKIKKFPEVIYDLGEDGKEPMIRLVGRSAGEVVEKLLRAVEFMHGDASHVRGTEKE